MHKRFIQSKIDKILSGADILLIIPPGNAVDSIALGPYTMQAVARQQGFSMEILQVDLLLGEIIGPDAYRTIQYSQSNAYYQLINSRLFARSAFDLPALGYRPEAMWDQDAATGGMINSTIFNSSEVQYELERLFDIERLCFDLVEATSEAVAKYSYKVVAAAIGYENQIHSGVALMRRIKEKMAGEQTFITGGSYFDDYGREEGFLSLSPIFDHVFVGEAEDAFITFLNHMDSSKETLPKIIRGRKGWKLDDVPMVDYQGYARQVIEIMGQEYFDTTVRVLWYESNRGCWWGDKSRCTFCSIPEGEFRRKKTEKILEELQELHLQFPQKVILFTDNIIADSFPEEYYAITKDDEQLPPVGFQVKVGKTLDSVEWLGKINTVWTLPGVESFSTSLLKRIKKGTTGRDNLYYLRNAKCHNIATQYSLLWGFPGDKVEEYDYMMELAPRISHLQYPTYFTYALIGKGSPLVEYGEALGVEKLEKWKVYEMVYPKDTDIERLGQYFKGTFPSEAYENPDLMNEVANSLVEWQEAFPNSRLMISELNGSGDYLIEDCRLVHNMQLRRHFVNQERAVEIMSLRRYKATEHQSWAVEQNLGIVMDGWYVPLIMAEPELLHALDREDAFLAKKELVSEYD
ncbi:MAG: radical SAM protein [Bacteroidota bacterium]